MDAAAEKSYNLASGEKIMLKFSPWLVFEYVVSFYGNFYEVFTCTKGIIWHAS